jgi:hypothetical protein
MTRLLPVGPGRALPGLFFAEIAQNGAARPLELQSGVVTKKQYPRDI